MPDKNKVAMMNAAGYTVIKTCYNCKHSAFGRGWNLRTWADCNNTKNRYPHERHSAPMLGPAHLFLICNHWEPWFGRIQKSLGKYFKLLKNDI